MDIIQHTENLEKDNDIYVYGEISKQIDKTILPNNIKTMLLLPPSPDILTVVMQMGSLVIVLVANHHAIFRFRSYMHFIIGEAAAHKIEKDGGVEALHSAVTNIISGCVSFTVAVMYVYGCWAVHGDLEAMVNSPSNPSIYAVTHTALMLHCAHTVYEMGIYIFIPPKEGALMWLHHSIVMSNFLICLLNQTNHYYACILGLTEGTNMCLVPVIFYKTIGRKGGLGFITAAGSTWVGFLLLRIVLVPWWIFTVYVALGDIRMIYGDAPFYQLCLGLLSASLILVLSVFWFYKLTRIGIKILFPKKEKK